MDYKHTQTGYLMIFVSIMISLLFIYIIIKIGLELYLTIVMLIIFLVITSFLSLTITINKRHLKIRFGYGLFRKSFLLSEIESVKTVRNHWYQGWGIKIWFRPYMILYTVSGFDAVEIVMKNKRIYRIGTDEPKKLKEAILNSINKK